MSRNRNPGLQGSHIPSWHLRTIHSPCNRGVPKRLLTLHESFRFFRSHMPHNRLDLVGEMSGKTRASRSGERAGVVCETRPAPVHSLENDGGRRAGVALTGRLLSRRSAGSGRNRSRLRNHRESLDLRLRAPRRSRLLSRGNGGAGGRRESGRRVGKERWNVLRIQQMQSRETAGTHQNLFDGGTFPWVHFHHRLDELSQVGTR